jgi:prophage regulatory protein
LSGQTSSKEASIEQTELIHLTPRCGERLVRKKEVLRRTGLSKSRMHDLIIESKFPKRVPIGKRAVAWVESEIERWIQEQIARRAA